MPVAQVEGAGVHVLGVDEEVPDVHQVGVVGEGEVGVGVAAVEVDPRQPQKAQPRLESGKQPKKPS